MDRASDICVVYVRLARGQLCFAPERARRDLIHRYGIADDRVRLLDVYAGQVRAGRARVIAAAISQRFSLSLRKPGADDRAIPHWLQRRERARTLEAGALTFREPASRDDALRLAD